MPKYSIPFNTLIELTFFPSEYLISNVFEVVISCFRPVVLEALSTWLSSFQPPCTCGLAQPDEMVMTSSYSDMDVNTTRHYGMPEDINTTGNYGRSEENGVQHKSAERGPSHPPHWKQHTTACGLTHKYHRQIFTRHLSWGIHAL